MPSSPLSPQKNEARATPAQLRALDRISRGVVSWYVPLTGGHGRYEDRAPGVRADVFQRCVDRRWAKVGRRYSHTRCQVELTDAGRAVLARGGSS